MSELQEHWPDPSRRYHGGGCGCGQCTSRLGSIDRLAHESISAALAHAQQGRFEADLATKAGGPRRLTLPGNFNGWMLPHPLMDVLGSASGADFNRRRAYLLYRIARQGGRPEALYIGMAPSASVRERVLEHIGDLVRSLNRTPPKTPPQVGKSEVANLRAEIKKELSTARNLKNITVQVGTVTPDRGIPLDAKLLHAFEAALQVTERPTTYVGGAWTFEEDRL